MNNTYLIKLIKSNLYSRYSGILSLSDIPLFLIDNAGKVLLEFIPSPDFCVEVCRKKKTEVCEAYKKYMKSNPSEDMAFTCKYGLYNSLVPILIDKKTVGFIGGMQVYLNFTEHKKFMIDLPHIQKDTGADIEEVAKALSAVQTVSENKIKTHSHICTHIAHNISLDLAALMTNESNDIKKISMEKEILEKKLIDLETKNLSLEINPHFLFNTLNSVARIAYFEKSHKTEELIYYLSDWLRYNLKQGNQLHTIESEINNINKYLFIQKARFKSRLTYDIDIPDKINAYRIPNMIIQPIVENSVIHGISPKLEGGHIHIFAKIIDKKIVIYVTDSGEGFKTNNIDELLNQSDGIGIKGTDKRLRSYYGEEYGIDVIKSDHVGSTVTITIPTQDNLSHSDIK